MDTFAIESIDVTESIQGEKKFLILHITLGPNSQCCLCDRTAYWNRRLIQDLCLADSEQQMKQWSMVLPLSLPTLYSLSASLSHYSFPMPLPPLLCLFYKPVSGVHAHCKVFLLRLWDTRVSYLWQKKNRNDWSIRNFRLGHP